MRPGDDHPWRKVRPPRPLVAAGDPDLVGEKARKRDYYVANRKKLNEQDRERRRAHLSGAAYHPPRRLTLDVGTGWDRVVGEGPAGTGARSPDGDEWFSASRLDKNNRND